MFPTDQIENVSYWSDWECSLLTCLRMFPTDQSLRMFPTDLRMFPTDQTLRMFPSDQNLRMLPSDQTLIVKHIYMDIWIYPTHLCFWQTGTLKSYANMFWCHPNKKHSWATDSFKPFLLFLTAVDNLVCQCWESFLSFICNTTPAFLLCPE